MLYGKLGVDFFSTSELMYLNMIIRLRLSRARPNFCMKSDNRNVNLGFVDCLLYSRRIAVTDDYQSKRVDMLVFTSMEFNYFETLAKIFIIPSGQNQFNYEDHFNNALVRRIALAMTINSAFTGSYTENPIWYQQFNLRRFLILRGGQSILDVDDADICYFYVTTLKAMNFQDDFFSISVDKFKNDYLLLSDLTSMRDDP